MPGVNAFGTQFQRGEGDVDPGPETFNTIANVTSISGPDRSRETIDVTSHDSFDAYMESVGGLKDPGEVSLEINYDPTESTHDLDDDFDDADPRNYQIVLLPGTADEHTWAFAGILTELSDEFPYDDKMGRSMTVKISGKPELTATGA